MSELIVEKKVSGPVRHGLMATVSALALVLAAANAKAEDADRPTVWIELGGQLEHLGKTQDTFVAPFLEGQHPLGPFPFPVVYRTNKVPVDGPAGPFDRAQPLLAQKPPEQSFGQEAKISFEPAGTDWVFSAALRYGRSNGDKQVSQQTSSRPPIQFITFQPTLTDMNIVRFADSDAHFKESHVVLDFQAGMDVGMGLLGRGGHSTLSGGLRFAQFTSKSDVNVTALPNMEVYNSKFLFINRYITRFQTYLVRDHSDRSFHGIGPSISWSGGSPLAGNPDRGELDFDWGANAALLFGRQKANVTHRTYGYERYQSAIGFYPQRATMYKNAVPHTRSHSVAVPNVGVFAGLSARYSNARLSFGYRADVFFGAMDAGIDARHRKDAVFHGPFAKISIGLGG